MLIRKILRNFDALVLRSVVTNYDFIWLAGLGCEAVELLLQKPGTVIDTHGDGNGAIHMLCAFGQRLTEFCN
jgi:hypothetical protein